MSARTMPLAALLHYYSDGDEIGWDAEFHFLRTHHAERLADLELDIIDNGIQVPITLGEDGRIWDGHHRLCVADGLGLTEVPVIEPELDDAAKGAVWLVLSALVVLTAALVALIFGALFLVDLIADIT